MKDDEQTKMLPSLTVQYDPETSGFQFGIAGEIPTLTLVGVLERIKLDLLAQQARKEAKIAASKPGLLVPRNGRGFKI